jgi:peptidoglycan/LPS O-acetylase OafA/YrhL
MLAVGRSGRGKGSDDRLPAMDGLRAIACLIVLIVHMASLSTEHDDLLRGIGKIGVWLFFVLSAFLLSLQLSASGPSMRSLAQYAIRRALRILLPFSVAVIVYRFSGTLGIDDWGRAIEVLTFQSPAGHLWTVPPEFMFYFALPPILFACLAALDRWGFQSSVCLMLLVLGVFSVLWPPLRTPESSMWFGWYIVTFCSGLCAAVAVSRLPRPNSRTTSLCGGLAIMTLLGFTVAAKLGALGDPRDVLLNKHFIFGPLWAVFIYCLFVGSSVWQKFMANRLMMLIGRSSYSIYLFHFLIEVWAARLLPAWIAFFLGIVLSILAGVIGFWILERPTYWLRARIELAVFTPSARVQPFGAAQN